VGLKSTAVELRRTVVEGKSTTERWVFKWDWDIFKECYITKDLYYKNDDL
jgi:hypothetical protein